MRKPAFPALMGLVAAVALAACGYGWRAAADDLQDRPKTLTREAEIASLLEHAGWVSPGVSKTKVLYMISWQACPPCIVYEREDFPKLQAAGVDTRAWIRG